MTHDDFDVLVVRDDALRAIHPLDFIDEQTLQGKIAGEIATRARQAGVPCFAIVGTSELDAFGARMLDLQRVLEAGDLDAIAAAAASLADVL